MQSAQSAKGRGREKLKRAEYDGTERLPEKVYFIFDIFRRKIEMRFIYYVFHFEFALSFSLALIPKVFAQFAFHS